MKAIDILKYLLREAVVVLVIVVMFILWAVLFSLFVLPLAAYIGIVMPLLWLCKTKINGDRPVLWIADLLFDRSFDWIGKVVEWVDNLHSNKK